MKDQKRIKLSAAILLLGLSLPVFAQSTTLRKADPSYAWWIDFGDPVLQQLIEQAVGNNNDIAASWERVVQIEAVSRKSLSALLPSARFDTSVNVSPTDSLAFGPAAIPLSAPGEDDPPEIFYSGSAQIGLSLDPDIWGRGYLSYRASRFDARASRGDRDAQILAVASRIAETYYDIVAARQQLAVLQQQNNTNKALLELLELRFRRGEGSALAVLQQRQQVAATAAQVPQVRALLRVQQQQLVVLLGKQHNTQLASTLPEMSSLPAISPDMLQRRPDVRAADLRVQAQSARSRSAVRSLLPAVRLSGQGGVQANYLEELLGQPVWGVGLSLSVPLFEGGRHYANIDEADAALRIAQRNYRQLTLQARQQVNGAVVQYEEQQQQQNALRQQAEAARLVFTEARSRYLVGLNSYLDVLNALAVLQQTERGLVQVRRDLLGTRVQYFTAIGGRLQADRSGASS